MTKLKYSGKTTGGENCTTKALRNQLVIDAQWSDLPVEVEEDIKKLWRVYELGNDHYVYIGCLNDFYDIRKRKDDDPIMCEKWYWGETKEEQKGWVEEPFSPDYLIQYLEENKIDPEMDVWIYWWW